MNKEALYETPRLQTYGKLEELTKGTVVGSANDWAGLGKGDVGSQNVPEIPPTVASDAEKAKKSKTQDS